MSKNTARWKDVQSACENLFFRLTRIQIARQSRKWRLNAQSDEIRPSASWCLRDTRWIIKAARAAITVETSHAMLVLGQNRSNPCFLREPLISLQFVALIFIKVAQKFVSNRLGNVLWSTSSWFELEFLLSSSHLRECIKFLNFLSIGVFLNLDSNIKSLSVLHV